LFCLGCVTAPAGAHAEGVEGYYRFPAVSADTVVFTAEGDLWTVPLAGGLARRLTTHHGEESQAAISLDGKQVAFSASYEGPEEVYVMPIAGGLPRRVTWESEPSTVEGWTPDGDVLYETRQYTTLPDPNLVRVDPVTLEREIVPLNQASAGSYDASGKTLFFARPAFHRNNTKRYQGGTARNIWRFGEGDNEAVNLTGDFAGEDHSPMVAQGRVFYVNDRDGTMNVWSMDFSGGDRKQHTFHAGWDVKGPSTDGRTIVYQLGADIWALDLERGTDQRIAITLASDFDQLREKWITDPMEYLTSIALDGEGKQVALTARGRVFVFPVGQGRSRQIARQPGVRLRDATFLPGSEEDQLLLLSDQTGEVEFYRSAADGSEEATALTTGGTVLRFEGVPSPDGSHVAFTDKNQDLIVLDVRAGSETRINAAREGVGSPSWSPDGKWLTFVEVAVNTYSQIKLYRVSDGRTLTVTSDRTNSESPSFSPDGKWLYFVSDRNLRSLVGSPWGARQPEPYFDHSMAIYQVALIPGLRPAFRPQDELFEPVEKQSDGQQSDGKQTATGGEQAKSSETEEVSGQEKVPPAMTRLVEQGLSNRLWRVPVEPGNYRGLSVTEDALFWLAQDSGPDAKWHLKAIAIGNDPDPPTTVVSDITRYILSGDRKKLLVQQGQSIYVFDAKPEEVAKLEESKVDLSGWTFPISVREDLRQIFVDAWRLERDYFYDPDMHGVDWEEVRDKYLPLVDRATTRLEVSDIIGEVVGELSALHISVRGGDLREGDEDVKVASLGARLSRAPEAGGYRIDYLFRTDPDYPSWRGPLADPFLDVEVGDVILSINGRSVLDVDDPAILLRNQQDRQVLLEILDVSLAALNKEGERELVVTPTSDEAELRYQDWEYTRRLEVERLGEGDIGYLHLRAMGPDNLAEWYRNFYPVFHKQGLIVDVRHNRGGNIDAIILEKLMRKAWMYWQGRVGEPYWNMHYAFRGHVVMLVNEHTASDGEAVAEGFRRLGLGKLLGTRTWGGEIWLSSNNRLSDGGLARAPQNGVYGDEREWLIEGWGVEPDMVVDNLPHETFNGRDAQLEAAVAYLQQLIEQDPRAVPAPPAFPDKSFSYPDSGAPTAGSQ
jgi:tricorn protease